MNLCPSFLRSDLLFLWKRFWVRFPSALRGSGDVPHPGCFITSTRTPVAPGPRLLVCAEGLFCSSGPKETVSPPQLSLNQLHKQLSKPSGQLRWLVGGVPQQPQACPRVCHAFYRTPQPLGNFQPKSGSERGPGAEQRMSSKPACRTGKGGGWGGMHSRRESPGLQRE